MGNAAVTGTRAAMVFRIAHATIATIGSRPRVVMLRPARRRMHDVAVGVGVVPIVALVGRRRSRQRKQSRNYGGCEIFHGNVSHGCARSPHDLEPPARPIAESRSKMTSAEQPIIRVSVVIINNIVVISGSAIGDLGQSDQVARKA
jgi:hypothetical protein